MNELDKLRAALPPRQSGAATGGKELVRAEARPTPRAAAQHSGLQPLTAALVQAMLSDMEVAFGVDDDGDTYGVWDDGIFYFFVLEQSDTTNTFQLHARWEGSVDLDRFGEAAVFTNEWNSSLGTPTAFARTEDSDGVVGIYAEVTVDYGPGVAPAQLMRTLEDGIEGSLALFDAAAEMFAELEDVAEGEVVEP